MNYQEEVTRYRNKLILKITCMPPSLCPEPFKDFTQRVHKPLDFSKSGAHWDEPEHDNKTVNTIEWNEKMIQNSGVPLERLQELVTLLENKAENHRKIYG
jgi:hypothetical protein